MPRARPGPDQQARALIDAQLADAGWVVQDREDANLAAADGVAVREFRLADAYGYADYLLFVDGKAVGVVEAKPVGHSLTSIELQATKYSAGLPPGLNPPLSPLPFVYVSTGIETAFINLLDPDPSYQDYLEQLTFLLFLKMADERARLTGEEQPIPTGYRWEDLAGPRMEGVALEQHYRETLAALGKRGGMLGLVELIGKENRSAMSADVKGDAYEGLLEKNAQDVKGGAGQYFTPRGLIEAMVDCIQPRAGEIVVDPACGTGGFLLAAHEYLKGHHDLDRDQKKHLRFEALRGVEIVPGVARLCAMNLYLHGIGPDGDGQTKAPPIAIDDALRDTPSVDAAVVITNPPFGKKSSITVVNEEGEADRQTLTYNRPDFWTTTSNKQLNFVQHVKSLLKVHGRAAVVVPDNVLFEGGAGEKVRRELLKECDVHTLLRLPTGIFYAQGVKANVLFFDRKPGAKDAWTKIVWVYDLRTNKHFTLKTRRLVRADLDDFVSCYRPGDRQIAKRPAQRMPRTAAGGPTPTRKSSLETRSASTSSGSGTRPWRTQRVCPSHMSSPRRSRTT